MMQCEACVVAVISDNKVWVEVSARPATCDHCANPARCSTGLLSQINQPRRYLVSNTLDLHVGDRVSLAIAEGTVFRAALASYGIPLLLIISGAVVGQWLSGDGAASVGMLIGLTLAFLLLRYHEQRFHGDHQLMQSPFSLQKLHQEITFFEKP